MYTVAPWGSVDTRTQEQGLLYVGRVDSAVVEEIIHVGSSNEVKACEV